MANQSKNINELIHYSEDGITSKELSKGQKVNVTLFCMAEGTEMTEHTSTKEGTVHVIEGNGIFVLEGEKIDMAPGVLIYMKKDAKHSLKAVENMSFLLTLV